MDPSKVRSEVGRFFSAGNPVAPFRRFAERESSASGIEKMEWLSACGDALERYTSPLSEVERGEILRLLSGFAREPRLAARARRLLEMVEGHPGNRDPGMPGMVNVLFLGDLEKEGAFGVCQPLLLSLWREKDDELRLRRDLPRGSEADLDAGFRHGVAAARRWLEDAGGGKETLPGLRAEFPFLSVPWRGESHGLSVAVGAISRFLDLRIPADVGFTGRVDSLGTVYRVDGIPEKLEGARDKGLRKVLIPSGNGGDMGTVSDRSVAVLPVDSVAEALERLHGSDGLRRALAGMSHRVGLPPAGPSRRGKQVVEADGPAGVLMTWVAGADPYGRWRDSNNEPLEKVEEGPILALARQIRPSAVYLLHTVGPESRNDYRTQARQVKERVEDLFGIPVYLHSAESLKDPTEVAEVLEAAVSIVREVAKKTGEGLRLELNVTSGSPQMQFSWYYIPSKTGIPCRFWKVRESRWSVARGEPRAVLTRLPR